MKDVEQKRSDFLHSIKQIHLRMREEKDRKKDREREGERERERKREHIAV